MPGNVLSPKVAPLHGDLDHLYYMLPWAHLSPYPNGIMIGSAMFAHHTRVSSGMVGHALSP